MPDAIAFTDLGLLDYRACLAIQEGTHARVVADPAASCVLTVEHPPVLTLGKHADTRFILAPKGVDVVPVDRGGEVTAHEPGQVVVYPILSLEYFRLTPKRYICLLEDAVTQTLSAFGLTAARDPEHPGVWIGREKVAAVGVRIKNKVTLHGLALNVSNDLELFSKIVPCGIMGRGVTTMNRLLGTPATPEAVRAVMRDNLARLLGAKAPRLQCQAEPSMIFG